MSELIKSLEASVLFLRGRYPEGHPLLTNLERQLQSLKSRAVNLPEKTANEQTSRAISCCERLDVCPFFRAVHGVENISDILKEYEEVYCCGPAKKECFRLKYMEKHGGPPAENISPTGDDFLKYI